MRSSSLLGLRGTRLGVEFPEPGGEPVHSEGGMELMERKRPLRPSLPPTRHSISSARMAVLSFSSWIILQGEHIGQLAQDATTRRASHTAVTLTGSRC